MTFEVARQRSARRERQCWNLKEKLNGDGSWLAATAKADSGTEEELSANQSPFHSSLFLILHHHTVSLSAVIYVCFICTGPVLFSPAYVDALLLPALACLCWTFVFSVDCLETGERLVSEMTCNVSSGTHSLCHSFLTRRLLTSLTWRCCMFKILFIYLPVHPGNWWWHR